MTQIDGRYVGGVNTYSIEIVRHLLQKNQLEIIIYCTKKNIKFLSNEIPNVEFVVILSRFYFMDAMLRHLNYKCFNSITIHKLTNRLFSANLTKSIESTCDILYTPTNYTKFFRSNIPQLVSLHDIQEKTFPKNFNWWIRNYRNLNVRTTLEFSKNIQVSSEFIKHDILAKYGNAKLNTFLVINEGIDKGFYKVEKSDLQKIRKKQVIFPAHHWPHKNHILLIEAIFHSSKLKTYIFIFTGPEDKNTKIIKRKISEYNLRNIEFTGKISKFDMIDKYKDSLVVISCSRFESSSIPILEGLACGCKAIASDIPPHKEMQQSLELTLFKDNDADSLRETLEKLLLRIEKDENSFSRSIIPRIFEWNYITNEFEKFLLKQLT